LKRFHAGKESDYRRTADPLTPALKSRFTNCEIHAKILAPASAFPSIPQPPAPNAEFRNATRAEGATLQ